MANSDNVIRAGLTPKLRDIPNLVGGLTYIAAEGTQHTVNPSPFLKDGGAISTLYDPPIPEFSVVRIVLSRGATESHPPLGGPSLVIATEGSGTVTWQDGTLEVGVGDVFFVGAKTQIDFTGDLVLYRAFVEV